jgi:hypothetical protein
MPVTRRVWRSLVSILRLVDCLRRSLASFACQVVKYSLRCVAPSLEEVMRESHSICPCQSQTKTGCYSCLSFNNSIVYKRSMKFRRLKVSEKMFCFLCGVFSTIFCLLLLWTVLDPIFWNRVIVSDTRATEHATCRRIRVKSILIVPRSCERYCLSFG